MSENKIFGGTCCTEDERLKKKGILPLFPVMLMIVGIMLLLAGCTGGGTDDPGSGGSGDPGTVSDGGDNTGTDDGNAAGNEPVTGTETDGKCEITAFATGKADSLLIRSGDVNILIDAGEETDAELICSRMKEKGVSRIDLLIVTHFDRDHAGGVPQIMENFEVEEVYYPDYATTKDDIYCYTFGFKKG